jgi:hypothetical protein
MNFLGDVKVNRLQLLIHFHESLTIDMSNLKTTDSSEHRRINQIPAEGQSSHHASIPKPTQTYPDGSPPEAISDETPQTALPSEPILRAHHMAVCTLNRER